MIPRDVYEIVHILGTALVFTSLGGATLAASGTPAPGVRRLATITHGLGAFLILLGGFGMLARIGFKHGGAFPFWLSGKIAIWLVLSLVVLLPYRWPALAKPLFVLAPTLAGVAVYLALYKPL